MKLIDLISEPEIVVSSVGLFVILLITALELLTDRSED